MIKSLFGRDEIVELTEDLSSSPLYGPDLAPVPASGRTWSTWNLAAIWVGMAVCIPTYLLASYMIKSGLGWVEALVIIFLANLLVTIPMILNGHAGVKYGIPFPVLGRAAFGISGIHIPSIIRAIVACGWFGIQTWIGGLAFYAIGCVLVGQDMSVGLSVGKFVGFALFWLVNVYFVWKGTESIRWLETLAAPILILMGLFLIGWGASRAGGFGIVLEQNSQIQRNTAMLVVQEGENSLIMAPLVDQFGIRKAEEFKLYRPEEESRAFWTELTASGEVLLSSLGPGWVSVGEGEALLVKFRRGHLESGEISVPWASGQEKKAPWATYLFWLTAMVGFWATMAISIADITRYVRKQSQQVAGQLLGLPGTMLLYSFVGVFVTCASLILFDEILVAEDAPWDPVTLLAHFRNPVLVIVAQIFMILATLSTNIAANVIAPANAFANAFPRRMGFREGGLLTAVIGILICPWWLLDEISGLLIFVSGLLGPVLGILIADYFVVRRLKLDLRELFNPEGIYSFGNGFNPAAMVALVLGVGTALLGYWVPALHWFYTLSWFSGFGVSAVLYVVLMRGRVASSPT